MGVVLAPANVPGSGQRLLAAGAAELYLGFTDDDWEKRFGPLAELNRMSGFGREANPLDFVQLLDEARVLMRETTLDGVPPRLYCVFNSASYTAGQLSFVESEYLPKLAEAGFAGVVASDAHLAPAARKLGLACVASTMCAVYNAQIAAYFVHAGMNRIILPRDIMLEEAQGIVQANSQVEYEVFLMRNGCMFSDSYCMGQHQAGQPSLCRTLRNAPAYQQFGMRAYADVQDPASVQFNDELYRGCFHEQACGLCALWRFERMGVHAYKVVGRSDAIDDLCADVETVRRNIAIAQDCATEQEYLARMQLPGAIALLCHNEGLSCYYPQVFFG